MTRLAAELALPNEGKQESVIYEWIEKPQRPDVSSEDYAARQSDGVIKVVVEEGFDSYSLRESEQASHLSMLALKCPLDICAVSRVRFSARCTECMSLVAKGS